MIRFACPICHAVLSVPQHAVGKKGSCPKCGQRLQIPALRRSTVLGESLPESSPEPMNPSSEEYEPRLRWWQGMRPLAWLILAMLIAVPLFGLVILGAITAHRADPKGEQVSEQSKGEVVRAALTEDQLAAWRKMRREHANRPIRVLGCLPPARVGVFGKNEEDCWRCTSLHWNGPLDTPPDKIWGWAASAWSIGNEAYAKDDNPMREDRNGPYDFSDAFTAAQERAQRSYVRAAVVVDMFSREEPRVLRWYWNDGNETKSSENPPNRQRLESLRHFFASLMRHASDL